ncbi:MAG: hypothetical protein WD826_06180, partial [Actinomycetota bacterium]
NGSIVSGPEGTALDTNIVYSIDAVRGLDVLRVRLPKTSAAQTSAVPAPKLPAWLRPPAKATVSNPAFSCRIG